MTRLTSQEIISALPKLPPQDIEKIKSAALFVSNGHSVLKDDTHWLFDCLMAELTSFGVQRSISFEQFKKGRSYSSWKNGCQEVERFFKKAFPELKQNRRIMLCRFLIETLIKNLCDQNVPITINTVAKNFGRLPEMWENAFPDYLASGLQGMIINKLSSRPA